MPDHTKERPFGPRLHSREDRAVARSDDARPLLLPYIRVFYRSDGFGHEDESQERCFRHLPVGNIYPGGTQELYIGVNPGERRDYPRPDRCGALETIGGSPDVKNSEVFAYEGVARWEVQVERPGKTYTLTGHWMGKGEGPFFYPGGRLLEHEDVRMLIEAEELPAGFLKTCRSDPIIQTADGHYRSYRPSKDEMTEPL